MPLIKANNNKRLKTIAIDLSLNRKSGIAIEENDVTLLSEYIDKIHLDGDVIGIDAPLSLPKGRKHIESKGPHFRECDLELKRRRIKFLPITLGGMRKLTQKGIELKRKWEREGKTVLEIFPGASRDMMGIRRKEQIEKHFPTLPKPKNIDEADALIGLFTLHQWKLGISHNIKGTDGEIIIAKPTLSLGKVEEVEAVEIKNNSVVVLKNDKLIEVPFNNTPAIEKFLNKKHKLLISKQKQYKITAIKTKDGILPLHESLSYKLAHLWLTFNGIKPKKEIKEKTTFMLNNKIIEVKTPFHLQTTKNENNTQKKKPKELWIVSTSSKTPNINVEIEEEKISVIITTAYIWHNTLFWTAVKKINVY